jgi:arginyl-tRNA synthetase
MTFDPEASLVLTGRTGVYALYSYARTAGILRKGEFTQEGALPSRSVLGALVHEREAALIATLASFPQVLQRSAEQLDPSKITEYVWRLGKETASFYEACPVLTAPEASLREARLWLVYAVNRALAVSLGLLGISPLERM